MLAEDPGDAAVDDVAALIVVLDDAVTGVVDVVTVVALATDHRVGTEATVERVVAAEADERIVAGVAAQAVGQFVAGQRGGGGDVEVQMLEVVGQGVVGVGIDAVDAASSSSTALSPAPR
jgi:hypothetical protein